MSIRYCAYCGRVAHRCQCADENSPLRQFLARGNMTFLPQWMDKPYKRGVPPQIKRRERAMMRRNYSQWWEQLIELHGESCMCCKASGGDIMVVIDHVLPLAKGGLSAFENLQLLCDECNRLKGKLFFDCRNPAL